MQMSHMERTVSLALNVDLGNNTLEQALCLRGAIAQSVRAQH